MGYNRPEPLKEIDKTMRALAKARVLGLGYGCGAKKFIEVARVMAGLELDFQTAEQTVNDYRRSNPKIIGLWARLEASFKSCNGKTFYLPFPATQKNKEIGRYLVYRDIDAETGTCRVCGDIETTWGGKLAENFCQGTARDILASAHIRCAQAGYLPVLSVHDELVFELDTATAEKDLVEIVRIMEAPRPWAQGLPLKAEGFLAEHYRK
jgi:DNA polymerase